MNAVTIVVADDHAFVRESLVALLQGMPDLEVVAAVGTADEAIDMAVLHQPDMLIMDIDIPGMECFSAVRMMRSRLDHLRVLFLSAFTNDRYIEAALDVGALGYVTKSESQQTILSAIRAVATGESYFSPTVQSRLAIGSRGVTLAAHTGTRASMLTTRELEILRYIARGLSKKEIAGVTHLSVKTVDNHTTKLMQKLRIHDRVELTRYAIREGLVEA